MATHYRVTGQRPSSRVTPGGQIDQTYEVTYETIPSGIVGRAEIPVSQYTAEVVDRILDTSAQNLERIAAL